MFARIIDHRPTQCLHGLGIVLATQRDPVDTQQLIIHTQTPIPRCGSSMDDILDKDAQIAIVLHTIAVPTRCGAIQIGARLALHTDSETGLLGVMHRNMQGQLLP